MKGEATLLGRLIMDHKLGNLDAIHLMITHSAELDYLLTWDRKLINKTGKVDWLIPKIMNPKDFILYYENMT